MGGILLVSDILAADWWMQRDARLLIEAIGMGEPGKYRGGVVLSSSTSLLCQIHMVSVAH